MSGGAAVESRDSVRVEAHHTVATALPPQAAALRRAYLEARGDTGACDGVDHGEDARLERDLEALTFAALEGCPELAHARLDFVRHVARHSRSGAPPSVEHGAELGLAFGCALGIPSAHRRLDPILTSNVARGVARIDRSPAFYDLVAQELRGRLLLGPSPKIGEYAGRGSLSGWLRTVAVRAALNLRRGQAERGHDPLASGLSDAARGPEVDLLRARYRGEFEAALRVALRRLTARHRAILALNVRDGMSCDRLAALYRVGRSTAKRWLVAAKSELATETKRELCGRLALTSAEYDSVAVGIRSAVDVSVVRLLTECDEV